MSDYQKLLHLLKELRTAQLNVEYNNTNWVESWKKVTDEDRKKELELFIDKMLLTPKP